MKSRKVEHDLPVGKLTRTRDVLPSPEQLILPEDAVKVTLLLSRSSVEFFKHKAERHRTKYQRMIRALVDRYAKQYSE